MRQGITQSDLWCPAGSQQQDPFPALCSVSIDLASAGAIAAIFPLGVPAEIAALVSGVAWGSIAGATLCSFPPADPGPFPVASLFTQLLSGEGDVLAWIALSLERYWWSKCCQCKPAPPAVGVAIASWNLTNQPHHWVFAQPINPSAGAQSVLWLQGKITNVEAPGTGFWAAAVGWHAAATGPTSCPNDAGFNGGQTQLEWGPGASSAGGIVAGAFGATLVATLRYTVAGSATCVGVEYNLNGTTAAHANVNLTLFQQITDPTTLPTSAYPPPYQPTAPSGGGSGSPTYGVPNEGVVPCNFAPIAANWIERSLAPRSRVADGGVTHVSGAGVKSIPAGAIGWTVRLTTSPPGHGHDAGDPPQLYQVGWMATSIDGVEISSRQMPITSGQEQFWAIKPTDTFVQYFLYPGWEADIQFWNTATPN